MKNWWIFFDCCIFLLLINLSFAQLPNQADNRIDFSYAIPINYSLIPTVNATQWWITNEGNMDNVPDLYGTLDARYLQSYTETDPIWQTYQGDYLLANGSRALTGNWLFGSQNITGTGSFITSGIVSVGIGGVRMWDGQAALYLSSEIDPQTGDDAFLTLKVVRGGQTLTITGSPTINDWFDQSVKQASTPSFASVTTDLIATDINENTANNLKLWEDLDIGNYDISKSLYLYRNAPESLDFMRFYMDSAGDANLVSLASLTLKNFGGSAWIVSVGHILNKLGDSAGVKRFGVIDSYSNYLLRLESNSIGGISTDSPNFPWEVNNFTGASKISIYALANVSATGYITRTSVFDKNKNVWDYIKDADYYKKDDGSINHSKFYGYTGEYEITDYSKPEYYEEEICEEVIEEVCEMQEICNYKLIGEYYQKMCVEEEVCTEQQKQDCELIESCYYKPVFDLSEKLLGYEKICETIENCVPFLNCYDQTITTHPYKTTEEGISLGAEIDVLRQGIYELNERIKVLETKP